MGLVGYIILGVILLLILLIFFVPYGVDAMYADGVFRLGIQAGPIRIRLLPKKPLTPRQLLKEEKKRAKKEAKKAAKEAKKKESEEKEKLDATEKVKPKRKLEIDFLLALLRMGAHAIRRFFRSFTIDFFQLHYTVATADPYSTATQYAYICSAVEALPSLCGGVIRVRRKDIQIGTDFIRGEPQISGRITLTLQLFRLVHLAVAFGVEFIQWKIQHRRKTSAEATERKDDNGRQQDQ